MVASGTETRYLHHPLEGGDETRLTTAKGLDEGPEYSPKGNTISFILPNARAAADMAACGRMGRKNRYPDELNNGSHIFRMKVDGILTYEKDPLVTGHPEKEER